MSDITQQQARVRSTIAEIEGRVNEGVRLLDEKGPDDWSDLVDLDDYAFADCSRCTLGWTHGSFSHGCSELGIHPMKAWEYGFDNGPKDPWSHESLLTAAWRRVILYRRAQVAAS